MLMLWGFAVDPPLRVVAYLLLGLAVIRALPYGLGWLSRHLDLGLLLGLVLAILFGAIGSEYGLSDLFWGVRPWDQFIAGVSITALTLLLLFLGHLCDLEVEDQGGLAGMAGTQVAAARPVRSAAGGGRRRPPGPDLATPRAKSGGSADGPVGHAVLPAGPCPGARGAPPFEPTLGLGRWRPSLGRVGPAAGRWATFAAAMAALGLLARAEIPARWRWWHGLLVFVVVMVAALAVALSGKREYITAATCLCLLPTLPALILFLTYRRSLWRVGVAALLILWVGYTNSDDTKLSLNGLEHLYDRDDFDRDRMLDLKVHPSLEINPNAQSLLLELAELDMRDGKSESAIKSLTPLIKTLDQKIKDAASAGETRGTPETIAHALLADLRFQRVEALFRRARRLRDAPSEREGPRGPRHDHQAETRGDVALRPGRTC